MIKSPMSHVPRNIVKIFSRHHTARSCDELGSIRQQRCMLLSHGPWSLVASLSLDDSIMNSLCNTRAYQRKPNGWCIQSQINGRGDGNVGHGVPVSEQYVHSSEATIQPASGTAVPGRSRPSAPYRTQSPQTWLRANLVSHDVGHISNSDTFMTIIVTVSGAWESLAVVQR
jgi:hypothetical protein